MGRLPFFDLSAFRRTYASPRDYLLRHVLPRGKYPATDDGLTPARRRYLNGQGTPAWRRRFGGGRED